MPKTKLTKTPDQIATAFDAAALDEMGRATGFLRRKRDITPVKVIPSLIAALGPGRMTTLTDLCLWLNEITGQDLAEKTFWDRLAGKGFPVMMDKFMERLSGS